jgi:cyanophycinase
LGLGLAEETGVIIRGGQEAEVFGDGVVIVIDGCHILGNNLGRIGRGEAIGVQNLRVHLLVAGQRLNLKTREIIQPDVPVASEEEK